MASKSAVRPRALITSTSASRSTAASFVNGIAAGSAGCGSSLSSGTGTGKVELDGNVVKWTVTYSGMTGPVTAGHFHGPAPAGSNAGVVVPFAGPLASPIVGSATLTPAQVDQLKSGLWYINLHTAANPGGEIRGQVK